MPVTEPSEDEDREPEALGPKMVAEGSPSSQETESELPVSTEVARHRSEAAQVEVSAVVASSHPLSVYGGIQVDETVLYDLAEAIRSGSFPMLIGHDIRRPLNSTILDSQVRQRSDGYKEVWIKFTVDAEPWAQFADEIAAVGAPGGFSYAF